MMRFIGILLSGILVFFLAACSTGGQQGGGNTPSARDILIEQAWVRAMNVAETQAGMGMHGTPVGMMGGGETTQQTMGGSGSNSAAYLILRNTGSQDDRLLSASSDIAEAVELHISEIKNDVMTMRQVEAVDLAAGQQVELKPGGLHIMLIGLKQSLQPGQTVSLTLKFERAGMITIQAEVMMP